jgi:hypothetical protein
VASLDGLAEVFDGAYGVAASDNLNARLVEVLQSRRLTRRKGREILHFVPLRLDFRRSRTRRKTSQIGFVGVLERCCPARLTCRKFLQMVTKCSRLLSLIKRL